MTSADLFDLTKSIYLSGCTTGGPNGVDVGGSGVRLGWWVGRHHGQEEKVERPTRVTLTLTLPYPLTTRA